MRTKYVVVKTREAGRKFGTVGVLVDADDHGRTVYETKVFPYSFIKPAVEAAREAANDLGLIILDEERAP